MISRTFKALMLLLGITYVASQSFGQDISEIQNKVDNANIGAAVVSPKGNYWFKEEKGWQQYTPDGFKFRERGLKPKLEKTSDILEILETSWMFYAKDYGKENIIRIQKFRANLPALFVYPNKGMGVTIDGVVSGADEYRMLMNALEYCWTDKDESQELLKDGKLDACEILGVICPDTTMLMFDMNETSSLRYLNEEVNSLYRKNRNKNTELAKSGMWDLFEEREFFKGLIDVIHEQGEYNKSIASKTGGREFYIEGTLGEKNKLNDVINDNTKIPRKMDRMDRELISKIMQYLDTIKPKSGVTDILNDLYYRTDIMVEMAAKGIHLAFEGSKYTLVIRQQPKIWQSEPQYKRVLTNA